MDNLLLPGVRIQGSIHEHVRVRERTVIGRKRIQPLVGMKVRRVQLREVAKEDDEQTTEW